MIAIAFVSAMLSDEARAKARLRDRLASRGISLPAAALSVLLALVLGTCAGFSRAYLISRAEDGRS